MQCFRSPRQGASSLARDTMLAIVMIVLNGLVGISLLLGGLRYHEQTYNLYGANAFLAVILPMSVLGLVLPKFTVSSPGPTFSPLQAAFLILMSVGLYGVFLAIQTMRHRDYFVSPGAAATTTDHHDADLHGKLEIRSVGYHGLLLLAYVVPIVVLAKQIAVPIQYGISVLGAPVGLGGFAGRGADPFSRILGRGPRRSSEPASALDQSRAGNRAVKHQPDDPGGSHHRLHDGQNDHPRARCR